MKRAVLNFLAMLFVLALAACGPSPAPVAGLAPAPEDNDTLLAAGVGAAAGYMAGRAASPQPQAVMVHPPPSQTIIVNKTVIKQKTIIQRPNARPSWRPTSSRRR